MVCQLYKEYQKEDKRHALFSTEPDPYGKQNGYSSTTLYLSPSLDGIIKLNVLDLDRSDGKWRPL